MTMKSGGMVLLVTLAFGLGTGPVQGQRGGGFRGLGAGPNMGRSLDLIIEKQGELGLTEDQLAQILELKSVMDAEVAPLAAEIRAMRDQIRTGDVDRGEGVRQLQALQGEYLTASAPLKGRVQEILTVEQHHRLQDTMRGERPGRGRGMVSPGRGGRGMAPGQLRGGRGGFGPRQGIHGQGRAPAFGLRPAASGAPFPEPVGRAMRAPRGGNSVPPIGSWDTGNLFLLR